MEKNRSLPMFMATLSLRDDFSLPLSNSGEICRKKRLVLPLQKMKKHRSVPRAQARDVGKSIFCFTTSGGICI